jgi:hypothetical protein
MIELVTPLALVALLAIPIILFLYSLRPRRQRVVQSSNQLWREALAQRRRGLGLRQILSNLSLLLLLLSAGALALSLSAPQWLTQGVDASDTVVIIDVSASMQTKHGDSTRFDAALRQARLLIDAKPSGARMLLIESARQARAKTAFEDNKDVLIKALETIRVTDEAGVPALALALGATLLAGADDTQIHFLTDAAFASTQLPFVPNLKLHVHGNSDTRNVAVTRFAVRADPASPETYQALIRVHNYTREPLKLPLQLTGSGASLWRGQLQVEAHSSEAVVVPFHSLGGIELQVNIDYADDLQLDNSAYAVLSAPPPIHVGMYSAGNFYLESVLDALPQLGHTRLTADEFRKSRLASSDFDVIILDRLAALELPPGRFLLIDTVATNLPVELNSERSARTVSALGESALVSGLQLTGLAIPDTATLHHNRNQDELVQNLIWTSAGPVAVSLINGESRVLLIAFDPAQTDWPKRAAFPLFIERALTWLSGHDPEIDDTTLEAGLSYRVTTPTQNSRIAVHRPDGSNVEIRAVDGKAVVQTTDKTGIYGLSIDNGFRSFAVNLVDAVESNIASQPVVANTSEHQAKSDGTIAQLLWPILAALGLALLLLEWTMRAVGRGGA